MTVTFKRNCLLRTICFSLFILVNHLASIAQKPSTRLLIVTLQDISFGTFFQGNSGGTVAIFPDGTRQFGGGIIEANISGSDFHPAIFEVEAKPGTYVKMHAKQNYFLSGTNGGSIHLELKIPNRGIEQIVPTSGIVQFIVGGVLTIEGGTNNPSGDYNTDFEIRFSSHK